MTKKQAFTTWTVICDKRVVFVLFINVRYYYHKYQAISNLFAVVAVIAVEFKFMILLSFNKNVRNVNAEWLNSNSIFRKTNSFKILAQNICFTKGEPILVETEFESINFFLWRLITLLLIEFLVAKI